MEQLKRRQIAIEAHISTIMADSDALESVASAFIVADKRKHGISTVVLRLFLYVSPVRQ